MFVLVHIGIDLFQGTVFFDPILNGASGYPIFFRSLIDGYLTIMNLVNDEKSEFKAYFLIGFFSARFFFKFFHRLLKLIKILVNLFQDDAPEELFTIGWAMISAWEILAGFSS